MELWQDQAIILKARRHGENGAIVTVLTQHRGLHAGYVRGAQSKAMRGTLEAGNIVDAYWQSRISENLGSLSLELIRAPSARIMGQGDCLKALLAACALCDAALPEREAHEGLYHGTLALFDALETEIWGGGLCDVGDCFFA